MPLSIFRQLGLGEYKPTMVTLQLADRSLKHPWGMIEDVLVKVNKFIFLIDFIVLDMEEDKEIPIILGRPFLATGRAMIDVQKGELKLRVRDDEVRFSVFNVVRHPAKSDACFMIEAIEVIMPSQGGLTDSLKASLVQNAKEELSEEAEKHVKWMDSFQPNRRKYYEPLGENTQTSAPLVKQPPQLEQKPILTNYHINISDSSGRREAFESASISQGCYRVVSSLFEKDPPLHVYAPDSIRGWAQTFRGGSEETQPNNEGSGKKRGIEVIRCRSDLPHLRQFMGKPNAGCPKKGKDHSDKTENNALLPSRIVTGWRICIDYQKLNKATKKIISHFCSQIRC